MHLRRPIIGVMGSGSVATPEAQCLGRLLASLDVHLLTGGGGGQMEAVCKSFVECEQRRGLCIGILPCREAGAGTPPLGYPNSYVELPIQTHLWQSGASGTGLESRNSINVLSCAALVVLAGSEGTVSEAILAQRYGKPCVLFRDSRTCGPPQNSSLTDLFSNSTVSNIDELRSWLEAVLRS